MNDHTHDTDSLTGRGVKGIEDRKVDCAENVACQRTKGKMMRSRAKSVSTDRKGDGKTVKQIRRAHLHTWFVSGLPNGEATRSQL